jgi:hypothetical protein
LEVDSGKPRYCVQECVAIELKNVAVKLIGAILDNSVDDGARVASILGIDGATYQIKLSDGIRAGDDKRSIQRGIVGVGPVDQKGILLRFRSVGGETAQVAGGAESEPPCTPG